MSRPNLALGSALSAFLCLGACESGGGGGNLGGGGTGGVGTKTAALTATENIEESFGHADETLSFLEDSLLFEDLSEMVPAGEAEGGEAPADFAPADPGAPPVPAEDFEPAEGEEMEVAVDEQGQSLTDWLNQHVFVEAQIESQSGSTTTYLLDPAYVCGDDGGEGGEGEAAVDSDCEKVLTEYPIRVVLTKSGSNVDVAILAGPSKVEVIAFELHTDLVAVQVDLGAAKKAIEDILALLDEEDPFLPETLAGVVRASLERTGEKAAKAMIEVKSALKVKVVDGSDTVEVSLAPGHVSLAADAVAQKVVVDAALGALAATFPLRFFAGQDESSCAFAPPLDGEGSGEPFEPPPCDEEPAEETPGSLELFLAGYTAKATFDRKAETLTLDGVGYGGTTSTLKYEGETVVELDLNPQDGRSFDATVTLSEADNALVAITPALDVRYALALASLPEHLDVPAWALDDVIGILLTGGAPQLEVLEDAVRVVSGKLELTSASHPEDDVTVTSGMCLLGPDDEDGGEFGDEAPDREGESDGPASLWADLESGTCD